MPKHKLKGPLTLNGAPLTLKLNPEGSIRLLVVARAPGEAPGQPADLQLYAAADEAAGADEEAGQQVMLQLAPRSDCIVVARHRSKLDEAAPLPPAASSSSPPLAGEIVLDQVQRHNLRLLAGEAYDFAPFTPPDEGEGAAGVQGDAGNEANGSGDEGGGGPFDLVDVDLEVRLADAALFGGGGGGGGSAAGGDEGSAGKQAGGSGGAVELDAAEVARAFGRAYFGRVVCVNEYLIVRAAGRLLLLRVTGCNSLTPEEQEEAAAYHCYRGRLTPETAVYLSEAPGGLGGSSGDRDTRGGGGAGASGRSRGGEELENAAAAEGTQEDSGGGEDSDEESGSEEAGEGGEWLETEGGQARPRAQTRVFSGARLRLKNVQAREERPPPTNVVHITTRDGEWFPVKKKLLRPCIALTAVVRDSGSSAPSVTVDVDTLTFDRVLIFLEALAMGRPPPEFALHLVDDLLEAASVLGLRALEQHCSRRLGQRLAALGTYTAADIRRATQEGKVWLVIQGMVLDVGRWLPQHPGGSTIIPRQALDCDCSRLFELYHASRESFLYLREFYIGELLPGEELPQGGGNPAPPSEDFLEQLRAYTSEFRMPAAQLPEGRAFKSF